MTPLTKEWMSILQNLRRVMAIRIECYLCGLDNLVMECIFLARQ